jgi:REP element-mobilizing transposase RayT
VQNPAVIDRRYNSMKRKYKPRLKRLKWLFSDHPVYYITVCTEPRRSILANIEIHDSFKVFAERAKGYKVLVGRYVIMPDHAHFFAAFPPNSPSVSQWMKSWKNALSKTLRHMQIAAQHWEKNFFDHVMRSADSYDEKWEYVRQNPVRAGLTKRPEDWPYQGEINHLTAL